MPVVSSLALHPLLLSNPQDGALAGRMSTRAINQRVGLLGYAVGIANLSLHEHGNFFHTLQLVEDLEFDLNGLVESPEQRKLVKAVREFSSYISANWAFIPNYGERYRYGEAILTAFVESTVNQVISKRMVKKQQIHWTRRGVHTLLQIRTRVVDGEFRETFARWYPGMQSAEHEVALAA